MNTGDVSLHRPYLSEVLITVLTLEVFDFQVNFFYVFFQTPANLEIFLAAPTLVFFVSHYCSSIFSVKIRNEVVTKQ